jgi:DnaJ-class molecular chaperone
LEAAFGCEKEIPITRKERCKDCGGTGAKSNSDYVTCPECNGAGQVTYTQQTLFGMTRTTGICRNCNGKGKVVKEMSWSIASKKQATEAIDMILHDMDESGVITSKEGKHYEEILEGMNADNWWS